MIIDREFGFGTIAAPRGTAAMARSVFAEFCRRMALAYGEEHRGGRVAGNNVKPMAKAIVTEFPHRVRVIEHLWITLSDGCRLGARMWLPVDAETRPVPAILEYIPYRKSDGTRARDEPMHGYFAGHGFAAIRVDQRGSGDSYGLLEDEYLKAEQDDALQIIDWISRQPWCNGRVGMMGKSWGGFNCLQVAALRPPALKAVLSVCSTDDRYRDDIHYMGGCLLNDNHWWGALMMAFQGRPPDPEHFGPGWRDEWLNRVRSMPFWPALWMHHPTRDDYWRHGSICEDWSAIRCPVYLVGGWADAYTSAIPRMLENLKVPRKAMVGPWAHLYPHDGTPAPAVGFLQEAVKWWARWLMDAPNNIMGGPMIWSWIEDSDRPTTSVTRRAGHWAGDQEWPSRNVREAIWHLAPGKLIQRPPAAFKLSIRSPLWVGLECGEWMGAGCVGEMPGDQRADDAGSLVFDSPPIDGRLDLLGTPRVELAFSVDRPVAQVALRLGDVWPDGPVQRVSYGVFNLNHVDGHQRPGPLVPGHVYRVTIPLKFFGHRFLHGHLIRLSVSTSYWPLIWPSPEPVRLTLHTDHTRLVLPVRSGSTDDGKEPFGRAESAPLAPIQVVDPGHVRRWVTRDNVDGTITYVTDAVGGVFGEGVHRFEATGTTVSHSLRRELTIHPDDPLCASYAIIQSIGLSRPGWNTRVETKTRLTSTKEEFHLVGDLKAIDGDKLAAARSWDEKFPRRYR